MSTVKVLWANQEPAFNAFYSFGLLQLEIDEIGVEEMKKSSWLIECSIIAYR